MAATPTVHQLSASANSTPIAMEALTPRHGMITLFGYGTKVYVERGHLVLKDGIANLRREARVSRVGHGLRRLVVIGSDGMVSFAALRWLADQKAAFVMLERDGTVLLTTGPAGPKDARLRRAQALAHVSGVALVIARDLIDRKLAEQERIVRDRFDDPASAATIATARARLQSAETLDSMRVLESQAAQAYWTCWRAVPVTFPKADLPRVPEHWRRFGARISPLTGSPRLSVNPPNAILNYLYAVLESEARLAAAALGLDPGLGLMHVDTPARDSLACDLMEPVRPLVDAYVLDWITRHAFRREWFFEERNGNCRLMGSFAERLSGTASTWAQAVAPLAERVATALWLTFKQSSRNAPATRLTQRHRREVKGQPLPSLRPPTHPPRVCRLCGVPIARGTHCRQCAVTSSTERLIEVASQGRIVAHSPKAHALRVAARRRNALAERAWKPEHQPGWLTERFYAERIQPQLPKVRASALAAALSLSRPYAVDILRGRRRPHPRHWPKLAELTGVSKPCDPPSRE